MFLVRFPCCTAQDYKLLCFQFCRNNVQYYGWVYLKRLVLCCARVPSDVNNSKFKIKRNQTRQILTRSRFRLRVRRQSDVKNNWSGNLFSADPGFRVAFCQCILPVSSVLAREFGERLVPRFAGIRGTDGILFTSNYNRRNAIYLSYC